MKKTLFAIIALLVSVVLIVTLALALTNSPGRRVAGWQTAVDAYITHKGGVDVLDAVEARAPEHFTQATDLHTYAPGPYYVVDDPLGEHNGSKPLPYPPEDVRCVLLQESDTETHQLIFAAYHVDLYSAEWVIHEDGHAPFSQATHNLLAQLGCALDLQP